MDTWSLPRKLTRPAAIRALRRRLPQDTPVTSDPEVLAAIARALAAGRPQTTVIDIPPVRELLAELVRRNYSPDQLRKIVARWERDVDQLIASKRVR